MEIISEKECDTNTQANKHARIIYMDNCMDKTCGVIYQKLNQCPENHINVQKAKISECKQKFKRTIQNIHISQSETFSYNQFCANFAFHSLQDTHTPTYTEQKRGSLQHWSMAEEKLSFQTGMLRVPKGRT